MFPGILKLVSLGGLIAGPAAPLHFRLDLKFSQVADLTDVGGPVSEIGASASAYVTLMERDTLGGHQAEFRFDSVRVAPGEMLPPNLAPGLADVKDVVYRAMIINGRSVGGFKTLQVNPAANMFGTPLDGIFPGFRATTKAGDSWSDTVVVKDSIPVVRETTTIYSWKASALADGVLTLDATTTGSATAYQPGATAKYVTSSTRQFKGNPGGTTIEGTFSIKQDITVSNPAGDSYPVKTEHAITIKRLP